MTHVFGIPGEENIRLVEALSTQHPGFVAAQEPPSDWSLAGNVTSTLLPSTSTGHPSGMNFISHRPASSERWCCRAPAIDSSRAQERWFPYSPPR